MSLEARDISFSYVPGRPILHDVNLVVDPGERVALTAPSGRGKTTLCRVLSGYLRPDAGTVLVDGIELSRARAARSGVPVKRTRGARAARDGVPAARAQGACDRVLAAPGSRGSRLRGPRPVQLIWQHPEQAFDPLLRLGRSLAEGVPQRAAARAGGSNGARGLGAARSAAAHSAAARLDAVRETGLLERFGIREAWLDRFPHELSGGELMRFCIVRALIAEPRYLVCDEMTAMLDAVTQAELWREVVAIASDRSMGIVLVSHSPALVDRVATRLFRLI
ncbi:ATP-binding cassette domain-containing protein [Enorma massiliensis]|uniref:ABC transporter ATP-binding protein n=1 Tax=Enorma massiliensis TaxID=1472761 RepID=UPI0019569519|nr:ATP-binding cassette domain-containing protein [Enorma massiliensis]MBM6891746.1 ATP-binding cassette domain-containing protein [Enorma massiliensis]